MKRKSLFISLALLIGFFSCTEKEKEDALNYIRDITSPTTITADKVWYVEGNVVVNSDLIIEAGTVIKFKENAYLEIGNGSYGSIQANGTSEKPILFTSAATNPAPGDWDGIYFYDKNSSSATQLTYCIFEYAGNACSNYDYAGIIEVYSTEISMNYCTVQKASCIGIYLDANSSFSHFSNNTIKECGSHLLKLSATAVGTIGVNNIFTTDGPYGISITDSEIKSSVMWKLQTVPYYIESMVAVSGDNAALEIEPGITMKMSPDATIDVGYEGGQFVASGTEIAPITFTSAASNPSKGDWNYIKFLDNTTGGSILSKCVIEYAAGYSSDNEDAAIDINSSNVTVTNCIIRYNEGYGIAVWYDVNPAINNNDYIDNDNIDVYYYE